MTQLYLDATTLIALGTVGELEVMTAFDGTLTVLPSIRSEVTTEPARTNLDRFVDREQVVTSPSVTVDEERAMGVLDASEVTGDVRLIGAVLAHTAADEAVGVVSDDRRVRTVARGLGADVTGTLGTIVRAVEEGLSETEAKAIVRRVDEHGLHMTAELRVKAEELIEDAG